MKHTQWLIAIALVLGSTMLYADNKTKKKPRVLKDPSES